MLESLNRRRKGLSFGLLGILAVATTMAAAAVPVSLPKADFQDDRAMAQLTTLTSGHGISLERAFGADDEDCVYAARSLGTGLGLHQVRTLVCGE